jgi:folate-binding protein YgfZ
MNDSRPLALPLADLAVIEATGADAVAFLHGQLTQDIQGLAVGQARLGGYCTAKGRLLGSMVLWKEEKGDDAAVRALVKADIAQALVKRLSMFVLRAKATLRVTERPVYGLLLADDAGSGSRADGPLPDGLAASLAAPAEPWTVRRVADTTCIAAPAEGAQARWWLIPDTDAAISAADTESAGSAGFASLEARWQAADIAAGLPWVQSATQDTFIPQTLNFDLIDGVSFTKGCYPGQEVVARAHYRGAVKRRMVLGVADAPEGLQAGSLPGTDTYDARQPANPCGRVVNAACHDGELLMLMEAQLADLEQADFRLGSADGPSIRLRDLPYSVSAQG